MCCENLTHRHTFKPRVKFKNQSECNTLIIMNANEKLFINALVSRKFIEESKAKELFRDLLTNRENDVENALPSQKEFDQFWGHVKDKLRTKMGLDIRKVRFVRGDEKIYLGICNVNSNLTNESYVNGLPTTRSPREIALFRVVLDEILRTEDTCRNGIDLDRFIGQSQDAFMTQAQELSKNNNNEEKKGEGVGMMTQATTQAQVEAMGKMTMAEREIVVANFTNDGWLHRPDSKHVRIGVRSFLELKEFILDQCPEAISEEWKNAL